MNLRPSSILMAIGMLWPGYLYSQQIKTSEAWERDAAWLSSASVNTQVQHDQLRRFLEAGDSDATLGLIQSIEARSEWPAPARERC